MPKPDPLTKAVWVARDVVREELGDQALVLGPTVEKVARRAIAMYLAALAAENTVEVASSDVRTREWAHPTFSATEMIHRPLYPQDFSRLSEQTLYGPAVMERPAPPRTTFDDPPATIDEMDKDPDPDW